MQVKITIRHKEEEAATTWHFAWRRLAKVGIQLGKVHRRIVRRFLEGSLALGEALIERVAWKSFRRREREVEEAAGEAAKEEAKEAAEEEAKEATEKEILGADLETSRMHFSRKLELKLQLTCTLFTCLNWRILSLSLFRIFATSQKTGSHYGTVNGRPISPDELLAVRVPRL